MTLGGHAVRFGARRLCVCAMDEGLLRLRSLSAPRGHAVDVVPFAKA
jgi:hypothetical protein